MVHVDGDECEAFLHSELELFHSLRLFYGFMAIRQSEFGACGGGLYNALVDKIQGVR